MTKDKESYRVPEKSSFKRRYLLRKHQEKEAEEAIKQYEDSETGSDVTRLDGLGSDSL